MKTMRIFFALSFAMLAAGAFEVEQVFRPERFVRGDTNVRKQQEIDEASWIWLEGLDVWGAAIFTETRPKGLEKVPSHFLKFRFHHKELLIQITLTIQLHRNST